jgi:hypothetical protein
MLDSVYYWGIFDTMFQELAVLPSSTGCQYTDKNSIWSIVAMVGIKWDLLNNRLSTVHYIFRAVSQILKKFWVEHKLLPLILIWWGGGRERGENNDDDDGGGGGGGDNNLQVQW